MHVYVYYTYLLDTFLAVTSIERICRNVHMYPYTTNICTFVHKEESASGCCGVLNAVGREKGLANKCRGIHKISDSPGPLSSLVNANAS